VPKVSDVRDLQSEQAFDALTPVALASLRRARELWQVADCPFERLGATFETARTAELMYEHGLIDDV
jgi:hypothetical protein